MAKIMYFRIQLVNIWMGLIPGTWSRWRFWSGWLIVGLMTFCIYIILSGCCWLYRKWKRINCFVVKINIYKKQQLVCVISQTSQCSLYMWRGITGVPDTTLLSTESNPGAIDNNSKACTLDHCVNHILDVQLRKFENVISYILQVHDHYSSLTVQMKKVIHQKKIKKIQLKNKMCTIRN